MALLTITRGLPGAGKTTFARDFASKTGAVRLNRDDFRVMLFGDKKTFTPEREQRVTAAQHNAARALLRSGTDVVMDDTNLRLRFVRDLRKLAVECGAQFATMDFNISVDEAIARQDTRPAEDRVPTEVILHMARFLKNGVLPEVPEEAEVPALRPYVPNLDLPLAVIVDIDGTIAIKGDRDIYDASKCHLDTLNSPVEDAIVTLIEGIEGFGASLKVLMVSGRSEDCRPQTEDWLHGNFPFFDALFMRPSGDQRRDSIVKAELFDQHIRDHYNVLWVFDDRNQVVEMWRSLGLTCFQVADGNF